ncbi:MAG: nicotinate phosphoribosyltransferase [Gammaproteobacteria bacterium]|nr:nicotinate phosphoribosyltransferase [Gammaproteobacteria bacterium]MCB9378551.1 nicotinate phosphoribosyltransferase [Holophagales bacterium]
MRYPSGVYRPSLALLTDLYQLTMAHAHWRRGLDPEQEAIFHLFFRRLPFGGGFAIACGLDGALDYLQHLRFEPDDLAYLETLEGTDGAPLFEPAFLERLGRFRFRCDVDALPEGTVVFAQEPLLRVVGPIFDAQIVETALLNLINYPTLVATKAARLRLAAAGDPVVEFGLRRAQGPDGALTAARAAAIGGCEGTSNLQAGRAFGLPVRGTHAHAWVLAFDSELEAFRAYAEAQPGNCVLLVDTFDSLEGVRRAVEVGRELAAKGVALAGIRLDSGDLAWLSGEARRILDEAGLVETKILASNDLDEHLIESLRQQGAKIDVWCVGTRLVTAFDDPALGGVYKLAAVRRGDGAWEPRLKLSEQAVKTTTPGLLQVRRFSDDRGFVADMIYDELLGIAGTHEIVDPMDPTRRRRLHAKMTSEDLLRRVVTGGEVVAEPVAIATARARAQEQVERLHPGVLRFLNPHAYPVGLELGLHERKTALVLAAREASSGGRRDD